MSADEKPPVKKSRYIVKESDHVFKMTSSPRGRCLIINNEYCRAGKRDGTELDKNRLKHVFEELDFHVTVQNDLNKTEMVDVLTKFSKNQKHKKSDAVVVIILTHGHKGVIAGTDNKTLEYDEMVDIFNNSKCPELRTKPKLFFLQACQGDECDEGQMDNLGDVKVERTPTTSDVLISCAAQDGYATLRRKTHGGIYAYYLAHVLAEHAWKYDMEDMLKIIEANMNTTDIVLKDGPRVMSSSWKTQGWSKKLFFNPISKAENAEKIEIDWEEFYRSAKDPIVEPTGLRSSDHSPSPEAEGGNAFDEGQLWVVGGGTVKPAEYLASSSGPWIERSSILHSTVQMISPYDNGFLVKNGSKLGKWCPVRNVFEEWTVLKPEPRLCAMVLLNEKVYVMGGESMDKTQKGRGVKIYDIRSRQWTDGLTLPRRATGKNAVVIEGKIYMTTGTDEQPLAKLAVLDPSESWQEINGLLKPRCQHTIATCGDKVWIFGGRNGEKQLLTDVECYCPGTGKKEKLKNPMPRPRTNASVAFKDGLFFVTGGKSAEGTDLNDVDILDPETGKWTLGPKLNYPRSQHSSLVL